MNLLRFIHNKKKSNSIDNKIVKEYHKTRLPEKRKYLCHAPFKSMTFFLGGNVLACWHNKQFILGRYPENSIHEIWFGSRIKKLRDHILNNDLSCGCFDCMKNLNSKDFYSVNAWRYDFLPEFKSEFPISMDFQIGTDCNMECIMCSGEYSASIRENREMKSPYQNPYDFNFIKQLEEFIPFLKEATFSGGEVFLLNQYFDIWEKFYELNPDILVSVSTNGTILNERVKTILNKLRFNITLSIDSVDRDNYVKIRKNSNLDQTLANLKYFVEYSKNKNTAFDIRICPMKQNWKELPDILKFCDENNIFLFFNTVIFPPYCSLWSCSSEKLPEIINYLGSYTFKKNTPARKSNSENYQNLIFQLSNWQANAIERDKKKSFFDTLNTNELMQTLTVHVQKYLDTVTSIDTAERNSFYSFFETVIKKCDEEIIDKKILHNALTYYLLIPVNRLVDEFNIRDTEKIINLTIQAGKE